MADADQDDAAPPGTAASQPSRRPKTASKSGWGDESKNDATSGKKGRRSTTVGGPHDIQTNVPGDIDDDNSEQKYVE